MSEIVRLLDEDPDLGEGVPEAELPSAVRDLVARCIRVRRGPWSPAETWEAMRPTLGLLVLDGLLLRDVEVARRTTTEVLGAGDLLRPWEGPPVEAVPLQAHWSVFEDIRLAVLDRRFFMTAARWPSVIENVTARATRRSRWLTMRLALNQLTRLEDRITLTLWSLAERWGRVTPQGVVLPLPLTHSMLARLVGARRPSVTATLGILTAHGVVERTADGGWLLHGEPTDALERGHASVADAS